jgi:hypothetical protein
MTMSPALSAVAAGVAVAAESPGQFFHAATVDVPEFVFAPLEKST